MKVFIMRGLPGSGKTFWVANYVAEHPTETILVCSADHFHTTKEGLYDFKPENVPIAHKQCFLRYEDAVFCGGFDAIFVDNTNSTVWELAPYYRMAEVHDCDVNIVMIHCPFRLAAERGTHNVPLETMWKMQQNLESERLPTWWKQSHVFVN